MNNKRIVITGSGPVTAIGCGRETFFDALIKGQTGITPVSLFSTENLNSQMAAEIRNFDVEEYLETPKAYLDRSSELSFAAIALAMEDADLDPEYVASSHAGILLGSAYGSMGTMNRFFSDFTKKGPRFVKPILFPHTYSNTAISLLAIEYNLTGVHLNFASGFIASADAILAGYDLIKLGRTNLVFAGGYESINDTLFRAYDQSGILSSNKRGNEHCAPFDNDRNGTIIGEAGAILVLEELEHAKERGAHIYGEITGCGTAGNGPTTTMKQAIQSSTNKPIDCIFASANGSPENDEKEALAIMSILQNKSDNTPITAIKSITGETMGAGAALQIISALGTLENGIIPPTANLNSPQDNFNLNFVQNKAIKKEVQSILSNSCDPKGASIAFHLTQYE